MNRLAGELVTAHAEAQARASDIARLGSELAAANADGKERAAENARFRKELTAAIAAREMEGRGGTSPAISRAMCPRDGVKLAESEFEILLIAR